MMRFIALLMLVVVLLGSGCMSLNNTVLYVDKDFSYEDWLKSDEAKNGTIFVSGILNQSLAANVIRKMTILDSNTDVDRIKLVLNSPGGIMSAFRAINNGIKMSSKPVDVINIGSCHSACAGVFASATGTRYAFEDTYFMVHQAETLTNGQGMLEMAKIETDYYETVLKRSSNLPDTWYPLSRKQRFFSADDGKRYNFVDEIITKMP